ncbi:lipopolysaccharide assembly protein LapA domain-containing protein [Seohaeicola zhoushanensis]|uniref:Phosphoribosylanthranilate isomerase n=1 Tax=Seohaeicola zhoushanensis TaxID=1569283 RepID=A0A8J3GTP1_9RHOB|nr:LapA family protein [Seohaeicola zhoushanensis]GHF35947.1 phosphoribosylanthranilate isomerase [Seohaeicola zhoushanensis]
MRYIRYAFLGALAVVLISVSLANRAAVELRLVPEALADLLGFNQVITLPLFVVVLGGIAVGLVLGFVWEWLREHKHRREASVKTREVNKLEREVTRLKGKQNEGRDEILAILDKAG